MTVIGFCVVVAVCLFVLDRQAACHRADMARKDTVIDRLVDRIQNPERVQPDLDAEISDRPLYVSPFDDEAFNELKAG